MRPRRQAPRRVIVALALGALAAAGPAPVLGHAIGDVFTLPIPLGLYLLAAGLAVAASFVVSAIVVRPPGDRASYPTAAMPRRRGSGRTHAPAAPWTRLVAGHDRCGLSRRLFLTPAGHPVLDRHLGRTAGSNHPAGQSVDKPQPVPNALQPVGIGGEAGRARSIGCRAALPHPPGPLARGRLPLRRWLGRVDPAGPHHPADGRQPADRIHAAHPGWHDPLWKGRLASPCRAVRGAARLVRQSRPRRPARGGSGGLRRMRRGVRPGQLR